jgi:hypothetical protein
METATGGAYYLKCIRRSARPSRLWRLPDDRVKKPRPVSEDNRRRQRLSRQTFAEGLREQQIEPHPALREDRSAREVICTLARTLSQKCRKR